MGIWTFKSLLPFRFRPTKKPEEVYGLLIGELSSDNLGCGYDVHTPDSPASWASAYALVSSAEYLQLANGNCGDLAATRHRLKQCSNWLNVNKTCASTGATAWGVPYDRKIWVDQVPVPAGTGFAIPTCHSIQALLESYSIGIVSSDVAEEWLSNAVDAAENFSNICRDVVGDELAFWYSTLTQHSFHVTNAISMLAGQIQRISPYTSDQSSCKKAADSAVLYLLRRMRTEKFPGWSYFGDKKPPNKKNRTNDLFHEALVCHGLLEYKYFGGNYADQIEPEVLYEVLSSYERDGAFFEYSLAEENHNRRAKRARVWAIGHALYVASSLEKVVKGNLSDRLYDSLQAEYVSDGQLLHRPKGEIVTKRVREVGHVLLGLANYMATKIPDNLDSKTPSDNETRKE